MKALVFPALAVIMSFVAFMFSDIFITLKGFIIPLLMIIMLGMGATLSLDDFKNIWHKKFAVIFGVFMQFAIMPFLAFVISKALNFNDALTIGMMLVGTSAGGTASNVITYLAKGDLALSVSMTLVSTLIAIFAMPFLMYFYVGARIDLPISSMLIDLVKITLVPLSIGVVLNTFAKRFTNAIRPVLPIVSISAIILIIAIIVSLNARNLKDIGMIVVIAVIMHNICGLLLGYFGAKICRFDEKTARTVAIEVAMQNSGLSVAMAMKYFTPISALAGALFSIWHNISGALFAGICNTKNKNL